MMILHNSSVINLIFLRTKFDTQTTVLLSPTEGESDFLPLQVFFFRVSSVIVDITQVSAIRALCFYKYFSHKTQGMPARLLYFPERGISLCLGEVQMKISETLLQALFSSAPHGFAASSRLLHSLLCSPRQENLLAGYV